MLSVIVKVFIALHSFKEIMDFLKLNFFIVVLLVIYLAQDHFVNSPINELTEREQNNMEIKLQRNNSVKLYYFTENPVSKIIFRLLLLLILLKLQIKKQNVLTNIQFFKIIF